METPAETDTHHHADWLPHEHRRDLFAAFTLLLVTRGASAIDHLVQRLSELQVVRGRLERAEIEALVADLAAAGYLDDGDDLRVTAAGRAFLAEWADVMRDRRRLARSFLRLYDESE